MSPAQRAVIADRLKRELESALVEYESASKKFAEIVSGVPSGSSTSDSILALQQTGEASRTTLHRYVAALEAYHNFQLHGIVPVESSPE